MGLLVALELFFKKKQDDVDSIQLRLEGHTFVVRPSPCCSLLVEPEAFPGGTILHHVGGLFPEARLQ